MIIYKLQLRKDGRIYIGQTVQDIKVRIRKHIRENRTHFELAVTKYGIDAFDLEIIDTANTKEELDEKEKYWIKHYDCLYPKGFNMCEGGSTNAGYKHSKEMRKLLSEKKKEYYRNGGEHPMKGKHHSEETKHKISECNSGENNCFYGKRRSIETVLKIKASRKCETHKLKRDVVPKPKITGDKNPMARSVLCVELNKIFTTLKEAATMNKVSIQAISRACRGLQKTCAGYHWKYID